MAVIATDADSAGYNALSACLRYPMENRRKRKLQLLPAAVIATDADSADYNALSACVRYPMENRRKRKLQLLPALAAEKSWSFAVDGGQRYTPSSYLNWP